MSGGMWNEQNLYFFLRHLGFSHRETDIIRAMLDSKTDEETAREYNIAKSTVNSHNSNIYSKSNTKSKVELITYLYKKGLDNCRI